MVRVCESGIPFVGWVLNARMWERWIGECARSVARGERDGTRAETRFRLSPKRTIPLKSVGASVQSTAGLRISFSNAG